MQTSPKYEKRWLVLGVMCTILLIIASDNTILNLALPSISKGFSATASQLQWVVDAYTLVFASLLITTGSIGDRYGRKRILLIGLVLFAFGSIGAALSPSTGMLIVSRAFMGLAGAMIMPSTLSILVSVFRDEHERAKAIAIWSSVFSVGAGIGPLIGGILINSFNWTSVFYLNLPIVAIGLIGGIILIPESSDPYTPKPDLPGVVLSIIGVVSLVYGMIRAGELGWTSQIVLVSFGISFVFIFAFIWWENHTAHPMMPLEFFKNRSFTGANVSLTISSFAMMGGMYFFSQYFQSVQGYSPLASSLCMLPLPIIIFVSTLGSVRLNQKIGTRFTITMGLLISGLGLFLFSWFSGINTSYWYLLFVLFVLGSGMGLTMNPATTAIMNSIPPNRAGIGSAMNDTTRELGGALGVAVLGALMNSTYRDGVNALAGMNGLTNRMLENIRSSIQSAHIVAQRVDGNLKLADIIMHTSSQAFVDGMKEAFLIGSFVMVLAAVVAWRMVPAREHVAEKNEIVYQEINE